MKRSGAAIRDRRRKEYGAGLKVKGTRITAQVKRLTDKGVRLKSHE